MKIKLDLAGAVLARPDYEMLRTSLAAVQAATPTAMAARIARATLDPAEGVCAMFAEGDTGAAARVMRGSFNAVTARLLDRTE